MYERYNLSLITIFEFYFWQFFYKIAFELNLKINFKQILKIYFITY